MASLPSGSVVGEGDINVARAWSEADDGELFRYSRQPNITLRQFNWYRFNAEDRIPDAEGLSFSLPIKA